MSETKIQAVLDYGERLKIRSENDILYQKITTYIQIQVQNVIIILIVLWYFHGLIIQDKNTPLPAIPAYNYTPKINNNKMCDLMPYLNPY